MAGGGIHASSCLLMLAHFGRAWRPSGPANRSKVDPGSDLNFDPRLIRIDPGPGARLRRIKRRRQQPGILSSRLRHMFGLPRPRGHRAHRSDPPRRPLAEPPPSTHPRHIPDTYPAPDDPNLTEEDPSRLAFSAPSGARERGWSGYSSRHGLMLGVMAWSAESQDTGSCLSCRHG